MSGMNGNGNAVGDLGISAGAGALIGGLVGGVINGAVGMVGAVLNANAMKAAAKDAAKAQIESERIRSQTALGLSQEQRAMLVQAAPLVFGVFTLIGISLALGSGRRR